VTRTELIAAIDEDLIQRSRWETKMGDLYRARYRGLRRTVLPFPNASDINWPLIDTIVDQLKSLYFQQLFATATIASFTPSDAQVAEAPQLASAASQWFDYQVKEESNLETEILYVIDAMLMLGRPVMKVLWDTAEERLRFVMVDPLRIIVPARTRALRDAERVVHVLVYSPEEFKRVPGYRTDDAFVKAITGRGQLETQGNANHLYQRKAQRQGITYGADTEIVVWEIWERDAQGQYQIQTFAPVRPDEPVKATYGNPNDHGQNPFVDFPYEMTQPDWFAPRGVGEIIVPFQAQLSKSLNELNDRLTITNVPSFTSEREIPNALNIRWRPGQILPQGVKPAAFPALDIDLERQMILMRDVAEKLVAVPDYGIGQTLKPTSSRTATEVEQMAEANEQSSDLRLRIFRSSLGRLYQIAWETLRQYASRRLTFWLEGQLVQIPPEALKKNYRIRPSGSADGVTRAMLWRKSAGRLQMFNQDPYIDQGELRKSVLEADDVGLVKRLYRDPQFKQQDAAEDQMVEIGVMKLGHPASVSPADDHVAHIRTTLHYIQTQMRTGVPPSPAEPALLRQHLLVHVEALRKIDPKMAAMAEQAIAELSRAPGGTPNPGMEPGEPAGVGAAGAPPSALRAPRSMDPTELAAQRGEEADPNEPESDEDEDDRVAVA
jgi:hypothetical protein